MPDLFSVTAPLAIRFPDGEKRIMLRCFPHAEGLVYLAPFWNQLPADDVFQFVPGPVKGEGPWKAGDAVITVLGCQGTDPDLAAEFAAWQSYLQQCGANYPDDAQLAALAMRIRPRSP